METEFIIYACPTGPLADQLVEYFERARDQVGPNLAHAYMPHCTLTGFFHDLPETAQFYAQVLDDILTLALPARNAQFLIIDNLLLSETFHGFELSSPWLKGIVAAFAQQAVSPTRIDEVRLKDWLHLSLAYGFAPEEHEPLAKLAQEIVDGNTAVSWELRLYQRHADKSWMCHAAWPL
jgi:ubiquitin-associated SH3 domain-containing protein